MKAKKVVLDTSIIIDGKISEMLTKSEIEGLEEVIVPLATLDELQSQASRGREIGFTGLDELKNIRKICETKKIALRFTGERPSLEDIKLARGGRLDAMIRDVAKNENAVLLTADYVQGLVGEAEGVLTAYTPPDIEIKQLPFEKYFTSDTMSLHLKEDVVPMAKRGKPGQFLLTKIGSKPLTKDELQKMIHETVESAKSSPDTFIEAEGGGAVIIQHGTYRIAIARPPFSDGFEITVVRPIVKLSLEDYKLSQKLMQRLKEKAEGIIIAGPPGSGKSTLAASIADFYVKEKDVIVKTLESPRDLQVGPEVTQYGPLGGDYAKTADILLLVRPDYTIFDEVRMDKHFRVFADMRLSGIGMIGVMHSSEAIDAIQRFIGKVELGMIPHVIDTVIFLKGGEIRNVYELSLTVRVPTGMSEADLARPLVEVRDFETGKAVYEIYTFGEENVVVPIKEEQQKNNAIENLARKTVMQEIRKYDPQAEISFTSPNRITVRVDNDVIARLIGKEGKNISEVEKNLGIHIDVEPRILSVGKEIDHRLAESGNSLVFMFDKSLNGRLISIYIDEDFIMSATVGKKNEIKISKNSDIGKEILKAMINKKPIRVIVG
ncbi:MAG: Flp pilus assembly complex ATPase component TadA [Candidatus Aenigmarchaeota archaeon]|nr:Flp pilus assembly complex ATPase component TadA [Candidatus Aenigmarchaeota archaeon]